MKGRINDLLVQMNGKQRLVLELEGDFRGEWDKLHDRAVEITIKRYREKRSLDANGYAWALIDRIAAEMRTTKEEVYRSTIRSIGGVSEVVCVQDRAVDKLRQGWSNNGLGWQTETFPSKIDGCTNVILYYGSSTYDSRQMSLLIDSLVQDCRALGIETRPQEEIDALLRSYDEC